MGKYCWDFTGEDSICEQFDNEGGHPYCILRMGSLKMGKEGVKKASKCLILEEQSKNI